MFKVNNRNTSAKCEICSKLTIKIPELLILNIFHTCSSVFVVNFEQVNAGWEQEKVKKNEMVKQIALSCNVKYISKALKA